jgi:alcohol dehydrogenase (cytochrome c)
VPGAAVLLVRCAHPFPFVVKSLDAQTGKALWHFNTGQDVSASPMTYSVNGKQYVAIAAGSDVFSFALP